MSVALLIPTSPNRILLRGVGDECDDIIVLQGAAGSVILDKGPGQPGPTGATGAVDNQIQSYVADSPVGGLRVVRTVGGKIEHADSSDVSHATSVVGLSTVAGGTGASVTILVEGKITDAALSLTPQAPLFFTSTGVLTHTAPTSGFRQRVGHAIDATTAYIRIMEPIELA